MAHLVILAAELASDPAGVGYATMTDQAAADALNAPQSKPGPFPPKDIGKLLTVRGKVAAALQIMPALSTFNDVDFTDLAHVQAIENGMDYLIAQGLADADDKTAVMALNEGRYTQSRAAEIGALGGDKYVTYLAVHKARTS